MKRALLGWGGLTLLGCVAVTAAAEEKLLPPTPEIETAARTIWLSGGNRRPLCAAPRVPRPDQEGVQELQQQFAPQQWVVRLAYRAERRNEIAQLDHLAKFGLLERRSTFVNIGPIQGLPAAEYRPTLPGWMQNMARGESTPYPCFYYGMAQLRAVTGYSESAKDEEGFSRVTIRFVIGADPMEPWASAKEAAELFPAIRQREGTFTFHRAPDGKMRASRSHAQTIESTIPAPRPAVLPGIDVAREAIQRTQSLPNPSPSLVVPAPCLPLLSPRYMAQLWKEGDPAAARQAILELPDWGSSRHFAAFAHARLRRLEQAGLVSLKGDPRSGQIVVIPSETMRPLIERHGNCLPLGKVRVDVVGVQPDEMPGERQRFKARYVVEEPAPWVRAIRNPSVLADLAAIMRDGQPFEGVVFRMADGWTAGYFEDRRPLPARASVSSVGIAPDWQGTSEISIAAASVVNHELHFVSAPGAQSITLGGVSIPSPSAAKHPERRIEVLVRKRPLPVLVVLSSYEPVEWHFRIDPGAKVSAVLAIGYHAQRVTGLPKSTAAVSAYASDGVLRPDPGMTQLGRLERHSLPGAFGVAPARTYEVRGDKVVVDAAEAP